MSHGKNIVNILTKKHENVLNSLSSMVNTLE